MAGKRGERRQGALAVGLWVLGAAMAETVLPVAWASDALRVDLPLAVALALAVRADPNRAMLCGFAAGLATDALSAGALGVNAGLNVLMVRGFLLARSFLFTGTPALVLALAFAVGALKGAACALMMDIAYGTVSWSAVARPLFGRALMFSAFTLAIALLMGGFESGGAMQTAPAKERGG